MSSETVQPKPTEPTTAAPVSAANRAAGADAVWTRRTTPGLRGPYTVRKLDVDPNEPGATLAEHLSRESLWDWLGEREQEPTAFFIMDEADGIEACAVDTGEADSSDTCDCYRCDLASEMGARDDEPAAPRMHYRLPASEVNEAASGHGDGVTPADMGARADLDGDAVPCGAGDGAVTADPNAVTCPDCIGAGFGSAEKK